ncbi:MAG: succinylglutamate desuccinylase/aspartoacylase family protein [Opitutaceae bacterium]|nr:succinylglutamate desuccinylase/aspartoacylase family protein [Opitutaceae bacterium]
MFSSTAAAARCPGALYRDVLASCAPVSGVWEEAEVPTETLGVFRARDQDHAIHAFRLSRDVRSAPEPIRIGLFAGLHGDEPAGCAALLRLLVELSRDPLAVDGYELTVCPVCNPVGVKVGTRENASGKDLNREFWRSSTEPEVMILEKELRLRQFHGLITLHADDTSEGCYGYAHGRTLNEALLLPALHAADQVIPRNHGPVIDGFRAERGVIRDCFTGVLSAPPEQAPRPFDLIFETPALAPIELQVDAAVAALHTILDEYRRLVSHAEFF